MPLASTVLHHADLVRSSYFDIRTSALRLYGYFLSPSVPRTRRNLFVRRIHHNLIFKAEID